MKRSTQRLTKRIVDGLEFSGSRPDAQCIAWDADLPGFGIRIYKSGRKAFVLSYRHEGRKHIMKLGDFGPLTVDMARKLARLKMSDVISGKNPVEDQHKATKGETVANLCAQYLKRHAYPRKKTGHEDERRINRHILPAWGSHKIRLIKRSDIARLHGKIGETATYEANRVLALISTMWDLARQWGLTEEVSANPARDIKPFKEVKRDRWVTHQELPLLAKAIDDCPNVFIRTALWLYILTGARRNELLEARWADVDFERRELRIGDTKAGRTHHIPLSEPAMAVLSNLPRLEGNPFIFPGRKEGTHLVNIGKTWRRIREAATLSIWLQDEKVTAVYAELKKGKKYNMTPTCADIQESIDADLPKGFLDLRLHDLRRTVGSWLATSGASLPLIGKVLDHSNPSTTAIYARLGEDPARKAIEEHGQQVMDVAKGIRVVK